MGSSMYAMGCWSRSSTPCRFGFGPASAAAPAGGSAGPSERVGLNTLRVATTVYAEAGARGDSGAGAGAGGAGGRERTCRAGAGAMSSHTMKAAQASAAPPSTTFRSRSRRGTSVLGFGREDESRHGALVCDVLLTLRRRDRGRRGAAQARGEGVDPRRHRLELGGDRGLAGDEVVAPLDGLLARRRQVRRATVRLEDRRDDEQPAA